MTLVWVAAAIVHLVASVVSHLAAAQLLPHERYYKRALASSYLNLAALGFMVWTAVRVST